MAMTVKNGNGRYTQINPKMLVILRERSGLTLRELARRSKLSPATISRIENGKRVAEPATLRAIARGLNVPIAALVNRP